MHPVPQHRCDNLEYEVGCEVVQGDGTQCALRNSPFTHLFPNSVGDILFQSCSEKHCVHGALSQCTTPSAFG